MTLTETQLALMLEMQESMNVKVKPNWIAQGHNWHRTMMIEAGEAIEYHGWK